MNIDLLKPVFKTIEYAFKRGIWIEITTLFIPGYNNSEEEIREIARFIASLSKDIPWHVSRFFPAYRMLDVMPTPLDKLERAYHIGKLECELGIYLLSILRRKGHKKTHMSQVRL